MKGWAMRLFLALAAEACAFEKIALVDGFDYAPEMDTETTDGMRKVLERVLETGADTILWRTHSGSVPRPAAGEVRGGAHASGGCARRALLEP